MPCACEKHKTKKADVPKVEKIPEIMPGKMPGKTPENKQEKTSLSSFDTPQIVALVLSILALVLLGYSAYRVYRRYNHSLFRVAPSTNK